MGSAVVLTLCGAEVCLVKRARVVVHRAYPHRSLVVALNF